MTIKISERQFEVLKLKIAGLQDKEIADKLNITLRTAKSHAQSLCNHLKVSRGQGNWTNRFGSFELKIVWVPNPDAPKIIVAKSHTRPRFTSETGRRANQARHAKFWREL